MIQCSPCCANLVHQSEEKRYALSVRDRKKRFELLWRLSSKLLVCQADTEDDEEHMNKDKPARPKHGGCGNVQPMIRKTGLELWAQYKPSKNDDDEEIVREKEQIWPDSALHAFQLLTDDTLEQLGLSLDFARPEWMILQSLPVPLLLFDPA